MTGIGKKSSTHQIDDRDKLVFFFLSMVYKIFFLNNVYILHHWTPTQTSGKLA